jgi:hypothetical protein
MKKGEAGQLFRAQKHWKSQAVACFPGIAATGVT